MNFLIERQKNILWKRIVDKNSFYLIFIHPASSISFQNPLFPLLPFTPPIFSLLVRELMKLLLDRGDERHGWILGPEGRVGKNAYDLDLGQTGPVEGSSAERPRAPGAAGMRAHVAARLGDVLTIAWLRGARTAAVPVLVDVRRSR